MGGVAVFDDLDGHEGISDDAGVFIFPRGTVATRYITLHVMLQRKTRLYFIQQIKFLQHAGYVSQIHAGHGRHGLWDPGEALPVLCCDSWSVTVGNVDHMDAVFARETPCIRAVLQQSVLGGGGVLTGRVCVWLDHFAVDVAAAEANQVGHLDNYDFAHVCRVQHADYHLHYRARVSAVSVQGEPDAAR